MEDKKKFFLFFNFLDAMQLMCPTMQLIFTIKSMKTLGVGELMSTEGEDMVCQLNMNQVGRTGGIDVKAEDIIDIIDGYKGGGYGV